ncbi:M20 family metallopeptidase [Mangrovibrevibacter kandeliae]|uniref:M20 family metallopeptidase n=1 Tax=Mangrovibrevibacter kandeliae TaxID=2968473 RepID=UPI00211989E0|nr:MULTISPECIES: M20/M25/M40 family metallo-hydrolase [unclassified Aurantimonas]MCQ8781595.1 M20/M25/M40 family metallo-hydrolase [Aurantimonas sp. CSK15Z-1]MCW4114959.1 M20/M25/M40 family metallo-hydrolase [Aurantimonas sp. MSK8Z-1]
MTSSPDPIALARGIDARACLATLAEMVRHKSYSQTAGERALAERMVEIMQDMGLDEAYLMPVADGRVNAIGVWKGTGGGKSLLFNGHLDTNPATEGWTVDPWGGLIDDAFIYGIGVSNMKAGDAAYLCAVRSLIEAGVRLKGDVILTFVIGELQGGIGTLAAVNAGLRADYFVNAEPSDLQAITMHAAAFTFVIELEGVTRHLSKREAAVDAIRAACDLVPELTDLTFSDAPSDEHRSINRVHVGVIHGALGRDLHEWRPPQVADFVRLKGSGRYGPGQTETNALADLRRVLDGLEARWPGLKASLRTEKQEGRPTMPAFEVTKDSRIVTAINAAYQAVRGEAQPTGAIPPPGFFGTDAGHLYAVGGMKGVVCGPGGRYNTMPDERVDIPDYLDMIRIYLLTLCDICELQ